MRRIAALATAVALLGGAVVGCSGDDSGGSSGALTDALGHVADTHDNQLQVMFGRPRDILAADGGRYTGPYSAAAGYGDRLASYAKIVPKVLHVDFATADWAVTAGLPPRDGTRISGVDTSGFGAAAKRLGAKQSSADGATDYRFRPDNTVDLDDPLAKAFGGPIVNALNLVRVDGSDVSYGPNSAGVAQVDADSDTLADNDQVAAVASCLDDPLAAILIRPAPGYDLPAGVRELGAGVSGSKGVTPTETLCVATDSDDAAARLQRALERALASGAASSRLRWSKLLTHAKVTVVGGDAHVVRLTATPYRKRAGVLFGAVQNRDVSNLLGG